MLRFTHGYRVHAVLVACLALAITACDKSEPVADTAGTEADRANLEAMAEQNAENATGPSPAALLEPRRPVVSERLAYAEVENELVYGHFAFPADMVEPLPAIIVIHEWWGLNDNVRTMANRLAGEGYIVLAVDLFNGGTATNAEEARMMMLSVVESPDPASENIRQAYEFVHATGGAPRVASLGWAFGGGWSLRTAMLFPEDLDAAVIYYGQVTDDEDRLRPITASILGLFGAEDRGTRVDSVQRFEAALQRLHKDFEIHIYPGARHAFANPGGNNYNAEIAEDAWHKTIEFLGHNLAVESDDSSF